MWRLALLALLLGACSVAPAYTGGGASPASTPPAVTASEFAHTDFTFTYPSTWMKGSPRERGQVALLSRDNAELVVFVIVAGGVSIETFKAAIDAAAGKDLEGETWGTLDGERAAIATQRIYHNGDTYRQVARAIVRGGWLYQVRSQTPANAPVDAELADIQAIVDSWRWR